MVGGCASSTFEADGTGRKETKARIRVQSEAGVQQWGQLQEGYNSANERVEIPYVRVLKEDGSVVKAGDDAVQDLSAPIEREAPVYTDYRQKHITVPGLRPGEVLEYDMVTVIHTPLAAGQFWADYDFDKSNIKPEAASILDRLVAFMNENKDKRVNLSGHTDSIGTERYNQSLSERRANSARDYITKKGVDGSRVSAQGFGETKPIADNKTKEGRSKNRRVEIKVQ